MSWHHPDLYFFLCLLAGLAAFLAIIYECICRRKPAVVEARRSTVNEKAVDPPSPPKHPPSPQKCLKKAKPLDGLQRATEERHVMEESSRQAAKQVAERFSRLCESIEDQPPKEQASRLREHFGIVGGARPAQGQGRKRP